MIELYGCVSPNVLKAIIAVEEFELPYRFNYVNVVMGENHAPAFGALNPNRRVPVIVDADGPDGTPFTLWESGAILIYLAEKGGGLIPKDAAGRYLTLQWLMFQMGGIGPMFGQYVHFSRYAADQPYSRSRYLTEVVRLYGVVEGRLAESPHLAGPDYTIADIASWVWLSSLPVEGLDRAEYPNMNRWIEEIRARPAVGRALELYGTLMDKVDMVRLAKDDPEALDRFFGRGKYARAAG